MIAFAVGFVALVFVIVALLMALMGKVAPEPELLVFDEPMPEEETAGAAEAEVELKGVA